MKPLQCTLMIAAAVTWTNAQQPAVQTCTQRVSEGDAAVGIQVVTDLSCVSGGLGCFADVCRFCKVFASPQAAAFLSCSSVGNTGTVKPAVIVVVDVSEPPKPLISSPSTPSTTTTPSPTTAPTPTPTQLCQEQVSSGDASVGIRIVSDPTCAHGGLGCLSDVCRFCRFETTIHSSAFLDCAQFGYREGSPMPPASKSPPIVAQLPILTHNAVGTINSAPPATSTTCSAKVSDGDAAVGIQVVTDLSCLGGGLGCFNDVCRFCRTTLTPQSNPFVDCNSIAQTAPPTSAPTATTHPPTLPPATTASAPVSTTTPSSLPGKTCGERVSAGDAAVGIDVVTDVTCLNGGVGCFEDVCRYCRRQLTTQSSPFVDCASIAGSSSGSTPITTTSPTTPMPTQTPPASTAPAGSTAGDSFVIDGNDGSTIVVTDAYCSGLISAGDKAVGISAYADRYCNDGGIGCFDDVCRYCKLVDTIQSRRFVSCSNRPTGGSSAPVDPTTDPSSQSQVILTLIKQWLQADDATESISADAVLASSSSSSEDSTSWSSSDSASEDSSQLDGTQTLHADVILPEPELPPLDPSTTCTISASEGDLNNGIISTTDRTCVNGGLGCFSDVCRFCKIRDSDEAAHLYPCADVTEDGVQTAEDPLVIAKNCSAFVSKGDQQAGISAVDDATCASGGLGCFAVFCRFCKAFETPLSTQFLECSSLQPSPSPTQATTTSDTVTLMDYFAAKNLRAFHEVPGWLVGAVAVVVGVVAVSMLVVLHHRGSHPRRSLAGQLQLPVASTRPRQPRTRDDATNSSTSVLASTETDVEQQADEEEEQVDTSV